jgi:hypothetical protein
MTLNPQQSVSMLPVPESLNETNCRGKMLRRVPSDWLANAHRTLDEAVFTAYGWPSTLTDQEILARLLALNHERAAKQIA